MRRRRFRDATIAAKFRGYPPKSRAALLSLREMIFDAASDTEGVGTLTEALRWQQPSYLTLETGSGSTIRLDDVKDAHGKIALYFHCQSGLIETFKELYGEHFTFVGQRSIVFDITRELPKDMIAHCISLALTHHLRKKKIHGGGTSHHNRHRSRAG
jgi:Domain of unknown function (DU1801)